MGTYVPFIIQGIQEMEQEEAAATSGVEEAGDASAAPVAPVAPEEPLTAGGVLLGLALFAMFVLASPFLAGFQNIIGILIIGFALYEAWKINRFQEPVIEGPLKVTTEKTSPSPSFGTIEVPIHPADAAATLD